MLAGHDDFTGDILGVSDGPSKRRALAAARGAVSEGEPEGSHFGTIDGLMLAPQCRRPPPRLSPGKSDSPCE
jgi:hypothetical protein